MSEVRRISKIILQIACQFLWLGALIAGLSGVYLLVNFKDTGILVRNNHTILPAILAIASAAVLLISGGIGCWVSVRESVGLQAAFVYLLVIVFCLEATAAVLCCVNIGKVDADFEPVWHIFLNYSGHHQDCDSNTVDAIQEQIQCCGVHNYSDWLSTPWFDHTGKDRVPQSCCNSTFPSCNGTLDMPHLLYAQGCELKLEDAWIFALHLIIISAAVIAGIQIVGLVTVAQLMKEQPLQEYQILDRGPIN